ncbi:MAG: AAA family ATPase [bacterium]|nr:AAA family ATPase [bacterium]
MITKNSIIAVAGKGGTGKTTFVGLLLKFLIKEFSVPVLAIDADPSNCLGDLLDMKVETTLGDIREEVQEDRNKIPMGMSKNEYFDFQIQNTITESKYIDLLTMGRPEGPGCYCFVNSILRNCVDTLSKKYSFVVIDNEAGIEHISRKTTVHIDYLFIISDVSVKGIKTTGIINEMIGKLKTDVKNKIVIFNRSGGESDKQTIGNLLKYIPENEFLKVGILPADANITENELQQNSILELKDDSEIYTEFKKIMQSISK